MKRAKEEEAGNAFGGGGEKVKDIEMGDLCCELCNMNFQTTKSLCSHVAKFHLGNVLYKCESCGKGFMSKGGIEGHKSQHLLELQKLLCTHSDCNVAFGRPQSLKKLLKLSMETRNKHIENSAKRNSIKG